MILNPLSSCKTVVAIVHSFRINSRLLKGLIEATHHVVGMAEVSTLETSIIICSNRINIYLLDLSLKLSFYFFRSRLYTKAILTDHR